MTGNGKDLFGMNVTLRANIVYYGRNDGREAVRKQPFEIPESSNKAAKYKRIYPSKAAIENGEENKDRSGNESELC